MDIGDTMHIIPMGDFRDHEPETTCWCCPDEDDERPDLWLHHAMDGRESTYELGRLQ